MSGGRHEQQSRGPVPPIGDPRRVEFEADPASPILRFGYGHSPIIIEAFQNIKFGDADALRFGTREGFPGKFLTQARASRIGHVGNVQVAIEITAQEFADLILTASRDIPDTQTAIPRRKPQFITAANIGDMVPRKEEPSNSLLGAIADAIEQEFGQTPLLAMQELAQALPGREHEAIQETALTHRTQLINGLAELQRILKQQRPPKRLGLSEHSLQLIEQDRDLIDELTALVKIPSLASLVPAELQAIIPDEALHAAFENARMELMFQATDTSGRITTAAARAEIERQRAEMKQRAAEIDEIVQQATRPIPTLQPPTSPQNPDNQGPSGNNPQRPSGRR